MTYSSHFTDFKEDRFVRTLRVSASAIGLPAGAFLELSKQGNCIILASSILN